MRAVAGRAMRRDRVGNPADAREACASVSGAASRSCTRDSLMLAPRPRRRRRLIGSCLLLAAACTSAPAAGLARVGASVLDAQPSADPDSLAERLMRGGFENVSV